MLSFEITEDDFIAAVPGGDLSLFESLDFDRIEKAALFGNDIDEQISFAYQEIKEQINEIKNNNG